MSKTSVSLDRALPLRDNDGAERKTCCEYCGAPTNAHGEYSEPAGTPAQRDTLHALTQIAVTDVIDAVAVILRIGYNMTHAEIAGKIESLRKRAARRSSVGARLEKIAVRYPQLAGLLVCKNTGSSVSGTSKRSDKLPCAVDVTITKEG